MKIQKQGFTLPEVATVTAMVAAVAALSYPLINNLIAKTEYAGAKLALSSLYKKCEAINMLGVEGTGEKVNLRGYKIKSSSGSKAEVAALCKSKAVVFISEKNSRPSLYFNIAKGSSGCLVSGKHLTSYPECLAKEQTSLSEAINRPGSLVKTGGDYYSFGGSGSSDTGGGGGKLCEENDPYCN